MIILHYTDGDPRTEAVACGRVLVSKTSSVTTNRHHVTCRSCLRWLAGSPRVTEARTTPERSIPSPEQRPAEGQTEEAPMSYDEATARRLARLLTAYQRSELEDTIHRLADLRTEAAGGRHPNLAGNYSNAFRGAGAAIVAIRDILTTDSAERAGLGNAGVEGWRSYDPSEHECPGYAEQYPMSRECGACGHPLSDHEGATR